MTQESTTAVTFADTIVSDELLREFDSALRNGRGMNITPSTELELRDRVLRSILAVAEISIQPHEDASEHALNVLDNYTELKQKRLVAVCFLRLLPEPAMKWVLDVPWRPKVVALFDSEFGRNLYRDRKVEMNLQAHQKMDRLAGILKEHEDQFRKALHMFTSLDRTSAHRQKLMSVINSNVGRVLLHPFLPDDIESQLSELYTRVNDYLQQRGDLRVVDAHRRLSDEIERFLEMTEARGTDYSQWMAIHVGRRLFTLIEEDLATNKAVQPAELSIETRDKKYPLHLVGQEINVGFVVKNHGPGYAYEIRLTALGDDSIKLSTEEITIGRLTDGESQLVEIPSEVRQARSQIEMLLRLSWSDFDGEEHALDYSSVLDAQKTGIDWAQLAQSDPYSLEPVTTESELVGRRDVLNRLIGTVQPPKVGSSIIQGQKRVGKTSIARALQSHLEGLGYLVVYLEGGDYVEPSARATVARLGARLCKEIADLEPVAGHITYPAFDEALSPLAEFLDDITDLVPDRRIVIILDEFDELPLDLYARGPLGNAFFLTLRSVSSRPSIGFILVGGEKMAHVMDCQGDQLNKWIVIPVDYFTRESDWTDYKELVQRPVGNTLEYTEEALIALHDVTAGNPFFTKLVCQYVFRMAVNKRDCYITRTEVDHAVEAAVREADRNTFQHFWEDGIFETGERATEKSIRRRRILIGLSDILRSQSPAPVRKIVEHPVARNIASVEDDLREFVTRKVLVSDNQQRVFDFKVPLFRNWLKGRGVHDVIATFSDLDVALREREQEEQIKVHPSEIVDLVERWGMYKGQRITADKVRAWLDQFSDVHEQRAAFTILRGLHFYSNDFVRQKMNEIHDIVRRGLLHRRELRSVRYKRKRSDILVSYLDSLAKSGAEFARLYADEARIYVDNLVEKGDLRETLKDRTDIQAIVFVDDIVATGESVSEYLVELDAELAEVVLEHSIKAIFVAVVAYIDGWRRIEQTLEALAMPIEPHACELLDETTKCFGEKSLTFPDPDEREFAKELALRYGKVLEKECPLGYGDLELALVFERRCPNNSLPILWSESATPKWVPLFKRH